MSDGILVINAGSSSIKFSLYISRNGGAPILSSKGQVEGIGVAPHFVAKCPDGRLLAEKRWDENIHHDELFGQLLEWIEDHLEDAELRVAGHRVVHGGRQFTGPVLVTEEIIAELAKLTPLAPLHQMHNLDPISTLARLHPGLPQVACFDTSFHTSNDNLATVFALPRWLLDEGVRRYGFHGLSYEYIAHRLREIAPDVAHGRVVVCHLGNGASMCAIDNGRSVATTLGFSTVSGLPMGTRCGLLDPGVILYLLQEKGFDAKRIEKLIYKESGLLGMSGISSDMRVLMESDDPHAVEAVGYFIYRVVRELGSLTAAMGGLDALVFTGGIGEHSSKLRARVLELSSWLGLKLDVTANDSVVEGSINLPGSSPSAWVIPTNEELMIANHTIHLLKSQVAKAAE
jgi:acetate kinase